jgi:hypothetical protein
VHRKTQVDDDGILQRRGQPIGRIVKEEREKEEA